MQRSSQARPTSAQALNWIFFVIFILISYYVNRMQCLQPSNNLAAAAASTALINVPTQQRKAPLKEMIATGGCLGKAKALTMDARRKCVQLGTTMQAHMRKQSCFNDNKK
jgi:hypothetical protein